MAIENTEPTSKYAVATLLGIEAIFITWALVHHIYLAGIPALVTDGLGCSLALALGCLAWLIRTLW